MTNMEGVAMKYYFLGLATLVVVICGCAVDGGQLFPNNHDQYYAPPAAMMARPGPMVDGPGPGVLSPLAEPISAAAYGAAPAAAVVPTTQVEFLDPTGMKIGWQIGVGYADNQLTSPGRYNFRQGGVYRLKLTNIPGRPDIPALYPTLEVYPAQPASLAFLSHNAVPVEITDEDLDQVESNNFVTKVIYLPDPRFQDFAVAGVGTIVSTQLPPGEDPVAVAEQRGTILLVLRIGNMDMEMPGPEGDQADAAVSQVGYRNADGQNDEFVAPVPIGYAGGDALRPAGPGIAASYGAPGMPPASPVAGAPPLPVWGQPMTSTPIGLVGPAHLPYGAPAALKSYTMRNQTEVDMPRPVQHFLVDVKHEPGIRMPPPVAHVKYSEQHAVPRPMEAAYPAWVKP